MPLERELVQRESAYKDRAARVQIVVGHDEPQFLPMDKRVQGPIPADNHAD